MQVFGPPVVVNLDHHRPDVVVNGFTAVSCTMFAAATTTLRSASVRHGTRASLERYTTIRTFFTQRTFVPSARFSNPSSGSPPLGTFRIVTSVQCTPHPLSHSRLFHVSFRLANDAKGEHAKSDTPKGPSPSAPETSNPDSPPPEDVDPHRFDNYPKSLRRLALSIPHLHRPTLDDLLNATTGFWQRVRIRFRWLTIRSFRKYNADDISAFVTWFVMSQTLWLFVGT